MYDNIVETLSHFDTSPGFGCILAHSMGLGKTLQVISFVDIFLRHTKARTALIVVPVSHLKCIVLYQIFYYCNIDSV